MKTILKDKNVYILRFDKNEEVIKELGDFCSEQHISAGSFSAIGAAKEVLLSYYNLKTKLYQDLKIEEDVEIVSVLGNVAKMKGKTMIHAHGSFSDDNFAVKAGHVKQLIVSTTCEVTLIASDGIMERTHDNNTGLNLLK